MGKFVSCPVGVAGSHLLDTTETRYTVSASIMSQTWLGKNLSFFSDECKQTVIIERLGSTVNTYSMLEWKLLQGNCLDCQ